MSMNMSMSSHLQRKQKVEIIKYNSLYGPTTVTQQKQQQPIVSLACAHCRYILLHYRATAFTQPPACQAHVLCQLKTQMKRIALRDAHDHAGSTYLRMNNWHYIVTEPLLNL